MAAILRVKDENGNIVSIPAIKGDKGDKGDPGEKGEKGERGAPGTVDGLPSGGYKGQSLVKSADGNGEVEWGGDGLEYDSVMTVPIFVQNGKTQYVKIAVDKNPPYAQYYPITQINEGAELVPAVDYANGYALGYAVINASLGGSSTTLDSLLSCAENIQKNLELLISGGYITNPIGLRYSNIDAMGIGSELSIQKDCRVYYNKMSERAVLVLYSEYRYIELHYYYDEADITDYWKTNYYVSGHWVFYNSYSKRGEKYNVQPASSAGYLLGCNSNGVPKYTSPTDLNLLQFTEQILTTDQQSQALANIGGLSKNQGTDNAGKFLGIGADGIVVPTEVSGGGGSSEWKTLFKGTIVPTEAVNSMSADLLESCEGMNEFLVWFSNTKNEVESPGNDNAQIQVGKASYDYGRLGDLTNVNEKIIHMILTDTITYSYVVYGSVNSLQYNTGGGQGGYATNRTPEYSKVKVSCFSGTYLGTLSLKVYGR